jgi:hypothetical protein
LEFFLWSHRVILLPLISQSDIVTFDLTKWYCYLWSHRVILLPLISLSDIVTFDLTEWYCYLWSHRVILLPLISPSDIVTVDLTEWYCYLWSHRVILLPLISPSDIVSSNEPSLILKIIGQCNFVCIMTILIKTITSVVKVSTYISTSITAHSIERAEILVRKSVCRPCTFILYIFIFGLPWNNFHKKYLLWVF